MTSRLPWWHGLDAATRLLFASLAALTITVAALYVWGDSLGLELAAISFFGLMHIALLRRSVGMSLFYFPVLFSDAGMLLANAAMASGRVYIAEANYTAYDIGAFPMLVISLTAFFLPFAAIVWRFDKPVQMRPITSPWEPRLVALASSFPIVVSYVAFAQYGTPWSTGQVRSAFWALGGIPQFFFTFGFNRQDLTLILASLLAFVIPDRRYRGIGVVLAILVGLSGILFGGRGGAIMSTFVLFLLPYAFSRGGLSNKETVRVTMVVGALIAAVLGVTLVSYAVQYRHGVDSGVQSTLARIALQGQVWWNIYYTETVSHMGETGASFWNEWHQFFSLNPQRPGLGSDLLLRLIAPPGVYRSFTMQDVRFAAGWPALGYYYFGAWGLQLVQVILAVLYAAVALAFKREVLRAHYVTSILVFMLWWTYLFEVIGSGEFWRLLNIRPVIVLALFVGIRLLAPHVSRLVRRLESKETMAVGMPGQAL